MVGTRLPEHILTQVLIRLEAGQSVRAIHNAFDISRNCLYTIIKNLDLWGVPYPPNTVKSGWKRLLTDAQLDVCNGYYLSIVLF